MRTRMYGGVGGEEPRGFPLSRFLGLCLCLWRTLAACRIDICVDVSFPRAWENIDTNVDAAQLETCATNYCKLTVTVTDAYTFTVPVCTGVLAATPAAPAA